MERVEFPKPLKDLLDESDLQAPLRAFADRVGEILADNKLPFFPDYTDHGTDHINRVLKSEVELVPKNVWETSRKDSDPRLLCDADAAVIIGGTLLHDIAMHLRPNGFLELVSKDSRFQPIPWFAEGHEDYSADRPWPELWEDFIREARRFSDRILTNIIGEQSVRVWKFHELPDDTGQWETNHCLIIGEFIRRHHARLAHEIAIYGFPDIPNGSGEGQFPAMGKEKGHPLMRLADLIGLNARSHGMSLRVCKSYLDSSSLYPGTPRPMGTAVLYPMALLRVADYLQLDQQRAPAVLLKLRNPQSPISVREWQKHRAVENIGPATDPRGKMVTVSNSLSLSLYLQLDELLRGLQTEIDHATAVLDESYGTLTELGLNNLNLATRRVHSNLDSRAFRDSLPYVPRPTAFTADPNLLTLLVEPLYGKEPGVGVRELMQNAVDAVVELEAWCSAHEKNIGSLDLPKQDGDVLIDFIKRKSGSWLLRVTDRGIGMTSETIENYFLRAGASFRRSPEWQTQFIDEEGQTTAIRAGRFGIGAFAVFLLGPSFRLRTRHASETKSTGYSLEASSTGGLIEITRVDGLPVGTMIEVEISDESVASLELETREDGGEFKQIDWFSWDWPLVIKRLIAGKKELVSKQGYTCRIRKGELPAEWSVLSPDNFDAVYWTFSKAPILACNGLAIRKPEGYGPKVYWPDEAQLRQPRIAVLDSAANLPLNVQRYELSQEELPFTSELIRDVTLSFIAHALVSGPDSQSEVLSDAWHHPLQLRHFSDYGEKDSVLAPFSNGLLRWVATTTHMIPVDRWLFTLLNLNSCLLYGSLDVTDDLYWRSSRREFIVDKDLSAAYAVVAWNGLMYYREPAQDRYIKVVSRFEEDQDPEWWPIRILTTLAHEGVSALGHKAVATKVLVSSGPEFDFTSTPPPSNYEEKKYDFRIWKRIKESTNRYYYEARKGKLAAQTPLLSALEKIDAFLAEQDRTAQGYRERSPSLRFVSEIKTKRLKHSPESPIAKIWNECLGPKAIPFNRDAREELIDHGCKHPELKRHIEKWQEMKGTSRG